MGVVAGRDVKLGDQGHAEVPGEAEGGLVASMHQL